MSSNFIAAVLLAVTPIIYAQESSGVNWEASFIPTPIVVKMESVFEEKEIAEKTPIDFPIKYQENEEEEYGTERILEEGVPGMLLRYFKVTFWRGEEISRELTKEEQTPPKPQIVSRGTKVVWRDLPTADDGVLSYWYKMPVSVTAYTPFCPGCSGRTYTGTIAGRGSCAVDPKLIKLGTKLYVPGYGICTAEDTGGAIDDEEVDVCFAKEGEARSWGRRPVEIYLLTR